MDTLDEDLLVQQAAQAVKNRVEALQLKVMDRDHATMNMWAGIVTGLIMSGRKAEADLLSRIATEALWIRGYRAALDLAEGKHVRPHVGEHERRAV
jgi:hypothetical protein